MSSRSMVLGNDGLLGDILLRVDSPTTLVRAALVCKRWYRGASFPSFLCRFNELNGPNLSGAYVSGEGVRRPEFVRVPTPQPAEHVAADNGGNFGFDNFSDFSCVILECRNGRVLYDFEAFDRIWAPALRTPFAEPGQDVEVLPLHPSDMCQALLLPEAGDHTKCYLVDVSQWNEEVAVQVSFLRNNELGVRCSASASLTEWPVTILRTTLLAGGKIYMLTTAGYILGLDMSTSRLFAVELPEGVAYEYDGNLVPCRGDDSALYLVHVKGDILCVWWLPRRSTDHDAGADDWVLKRTVSVKETCGDFIEQQQGSEEADGVAPPNAPEQAVDGSNATSIVVGAGDNAEFVFLELGDSGTIVYLHLGSKKVEKVYQRDPDDDNTIRVCPFMVLRRPVFPLLREDAEA